MKNKIFILFSMCMVVLAMASVSADVVNHGWRTITINNYITNINDFPEYIFVSGGYLNPGMCPIEIVGNDGKIGSYYKFCSAFVYAIPKDNFNLDKINEINQNESKSSEDVENYLKSISGKKVIDNVMTYGEVRTTSLILGKTAEYSIDISQLKESPDQVNEITDQVKIKPDNVKVNNALIYIYIIIPIIALVIIFLMIVKRKKK